MQSPPPHVSPAEFTLHGEAEERALRSHLDAAPLPYSRKLQIAQVLNRTDLPPVQLTLSALLCRQHDGWLLQTQSNTRKLRFPSLNITRNNRVGQACTLSPFPSQPQSRSRHPAERYLHESFSHATRGPPARLQDRPTPSIVSPIGRLQCQPDLTLPSWAATLPILTCIAMRSAACLLDGAVLS